MNIVAIIHTGGLGDFLQLLPVLRGIRRRHPGVEVHLVGRPEWAVLAKRARLADRVTAFETSRLHRLFVRGTSFDRACPAVAGADLILSFLPDETFRANLARLTGARVIGARSFPRPGGTGVPAARYIYDQVATELDLPASDAIPRLPLPDDPAVSASVADRFTCTRGCVAVHPGSGSRKKNWPLSNFHRLCERFRERGLRPVWLLGPAEMEREEFAPLLEAGACLAGATLPEVASLLTVACLYVGGDNGVTHLAASVGTPTVALFGPSDARVWAPRGSHVQCVVSESARMDGVSVDAAWKAACRLRPAAKCGPEQTGRANPVGPQPENNVDYG